MSKQITVTTIQAAPPVESDDKNSIVIEKSDCYLHLELREDKLVASTGVGSDDDDFDRAASRHCDGEYVELWLEFSVSEVLEGTIESYGHGRADVIELDIEAKPKIDALRTELASMIEKIDTITYDTESGAHIVRNSDEARVSTGLEGVAQSCPEGGAQTAPKSTEGSMDTDNGVVPKAITIAIENLAGGEHSECVQQLLGTLRPYFAKNAERGLAHKWIRPTLGLDESAPYRFDFYAQEIDKLKARQDAGNKLPQLNDDLIAILGRPNFACANIAQVLRAGGMGIAKRSENEQAAVIHFLLGHYLSDAAGWADNVSAAFDTILASVAQQEVQP